MTDGQDGARDERTRDAQPGDGAAPEGTRGGSTGREESSSEPTGEADHPWAESASGGVGSDQQAQRGPGEGRLGEPTLFAQENGQSTSRVAVEREQEPIPVDEYTTDRRSLAALVQAQWAINAAIGAVIFGLIITAALTVVDVNPRVGALSILILLVLSGVWVLLRYRVWVYQIRDDAIYLERGVVTHVRTLVPYVRIQHVDTSRGPVERALGLSTLVVYTAGSRGADVSIPGLRPHEASDLQQRIKELAIEADGDDAL